MKNVGCFDNATQSADGQQCESKYNIQANVDDHIDHEIICRCKSTRSHRKENYQVRQVASRMQRPGVWGTEVSSGSKDKIPVSMVSGVKAKHFKGKLPTTQSDEWDQKARWGLGASSPVGIRGKVPVSRGSGDSGEQSPQQLNLFRCAYV